MNSSRDRFLDLMKNEILKLDLAELDFGIYRILNYRRAEIEAFFDEELPAALDEAMTGDDGESEFAQSEEDRLYNALYTFFSRYYRDGDFQPQQRRARDARYSVPYNGEDVHFHWRSKGSHYIKTTEELKSYAFRSGGWRVRFELVEAFQEPDNVKGTTRYFIPVPDECRTDVGDDGNVFVVPFAFRKLTVAENKRWGKKSDAIDGNSTQERLINDVGDDINPPGGVTKTDLLRHMQRYARKNRTDYFVHPHLGEFLRGELDYYVKNEFLDIEALTSTDAITDRLVKMHAVRDVANRIIDMLDEIESFQARLFEKRKFVLANSYLVPIRMVPEELWDDVLASSAQLDQWRRDFGLKGRIGRKTLESHPTLIVDTSLHPVVFQSQFLASIEGINDAIGGVLVNSENHGALRTVAPLLRGTLDVVYTDPPYNTGNDGFLYKDAFSVHSTWLSMMNSRIRLAVSLLAKDGLLCIHIDEHERENLKLLIDSVLGDGSFLGEVIWDKRNPKGDSRGVAQQHETILFYARSRDGFAAVGGSLQRRKPNGGRIVDHAAAMWKEGRESGKTRQEIEDAFRGWLSEQPFSGGERAYNRLDDQGRVFQSVSMGWPNRQRAPEEYFRPLRHPSTGQLCPIPERGWRNPPRTMDELLAADLVLFGSDHSTIPRRKYLLEENLTENIPSLLYHGGSDGGMLSDLALSYDDPSIKPMVVASQVLNASGKSRSIVLDPFSGSGTVGHAAIDTTRRGFGVHEFVLIEMGDYFESVLKPRIAKVMYAPDWEDGVPRVEPDFGEASPEWVDRSPRLVQVIKLESYEDSLNSLVVDADDQIGRAYRIRYAIPASVDNSPVLLATDRLESPFDYQLEVHTDEGVEYRDVDLVTTFNLIKGIRMKRYRELDHEGRRYVVVEGLDSGRAVLVLWRNVAGLDPEAEVAFLDEAIPVALGVELGAYDVIWHNADSTIPKSMSLDAEFKRLMFEPEPALS